MLIIIMSDEANNQGWSWCDDVESGGESSPQKSPAQSKATPQPLQGKKMELSESPKSSKTDKKTLHITGRRLTYGPTCLTEKEGRTTKTITFKCCGNVDVTVNVRDTHNICDKPNPVAEIFEIVGENMPEDAKQYVINRRAAVLPHKCNGCSRFCPPLYKCYNCGVLMWGIFLDEHEMNCKNEIF